MRTLIANAYRATREAAEPPADEVLVDQQVERTWQTCMQSSLRTLMVDLPALGSGSSIDAATSRATSIWLPSNLKEGDAVFADFVKDVVLPLALQNLFQEALAQKNITHDVWRLFAWPLLLRPQGSGEVASAVRQSGFDIGQLVEQLINEAQGLDAELDALLQAQPVDLAAVFPLLNRYFCGHYAKIASDIEGFGEVVASSAYPAAKQIAELCTAITNRTGTMYVAALLDFFQNQCELTSDYAIFCDANLWEVVSQVIDDSTEPDALRSELQEQIAQGLQDRVAIAVQKLLKSRCLGDINYVSFFPNIFEAYFQYSHVFADAQGRDDGDGWGIADIDFNNYPIVQMALAAKDMAVASLQAEAALAAPLSSEQIAKLEQYDPTRDLFTDFTIWKRSKS